jgi:DNA-binding MarR family transcriptional regulator
VDTPRWLDETEMATWRAFLRGATDLFERLDAELTSEHSLSLAEYEILVVLSESCPGLRMKDLACAARVSRSRLTHTCNRLEAAGLLERVECPTDRRGLVAHLTDAGRSRLEHAAPTHLRGVRQYLIDAVGPDGHGPLTEAMNRIAMAVERE